MSKIRIASLACLALISAGFATAARAENVPDNAAFAQRLFVAKSFDKKTYACFVRRYDGAHLAQHRLQKVTAMKLLVAVEKLSDDEELHYSFHVGVNLRNRPGNFASGGSCGHAEASTTKTGQIEIQCSADCDGGGVQVSLAEGDKAVMVGLEQIHISGADKRNENVEMALQGGADDKVFQLDRVDVEQCASLITDREELAAMRRK